MKETMAPPKVFISYSHDSLSHQAKILALANRLRSDGIDAVLDQYESFPLRGWIHWMKHQIRDTQFILVICTDTYRKRWDGDEEAGLGLGATYESQLIQQLLYDAGGVNERFVPVLLGEGDERYLPLELRRYSHFPLYTERGYDALYRLLTNQPKVQEPILGQALPLREPKPDFQSVVWNAPPRNPFFTGRAKYLQALRKALTRTSSVALSQPHAITGLGGIGKTQTAIEYAHLYRAEYPAVLWSGADSRDALLSGFAALATLLDIPEKDEQDLSLVAAAVRRWLESNSGWLLVLDNVENLAQLRQLAPAGAQGHLLITTRLRASGELAELIELKKMDPEEGALFLLRRAKRIHKTQYLEAASEADRALASQISSEMDGLPLALDQAGAFIEETPSTLGEYLALYSSEGAALRIRRGKVALNHSSVTITFSLAFARVAAANPAAADLIRGCAFLAPDAIPEEIFTLGGRKWGKPIAKLVANPLAWLEAIEEAGRFALIQRDPESKTLSIHRLVQEVVKDEMGAETRRRWAKRTLQALNEVLPEPEFQNWPCYERLLPHAQACAEHIKKRRLESQGAGHLLSKTGYYLWHRASYPNSEALHRGALAIREKTLGPEHPDVAVSLNNLALVLHDQGRYDKAEQLYRRALAIRKKKLGLEHVDTARSLNNLALVLHDKGRYDKAEPLYRRALTIRKKILGPEHRSVGQTLNNLAGLYQAERRYADAETFHAQALAIREKELGPKHPDVAASLNNFGELYQAQGRFSAAEPLFRRALAIFEEALGRNHPNVAVVLHNLALLLRFTDRLGEAAEMEGRAITIREKALVQDHPNLGASLENYAALLRAAGGSSEAEIYEARATAIRRQQPPTRTAHNREPIQGAP